MPNKYRVKKGTFRQKGKVYTEGKAVVSDHDLAKMFPNKFKVLSGPKATRTQELIDTNESLPGAIRRPRAATIGTGEEEDESKNEDGDDSEKLDAVQGEDSELADDQLPEEDDEEGGDEESSESRPKRKKKKNRNR